MTRAYSRVCNPPRKLFGNAEIAVLGDASEPGLGATSRAGPHNRRGRMGLAVWTSA